MTDKRNPREDLLDAIDRTYAYGVLGYDKPEDLADAYRDSILAALGLLPVPEPVLRDLVKVAMWVSRGHSMALTPDPSPFVGTAYPDATARRALGALDDAGLLDQYRREGR
ncbi:hypothetical protein ACH3XX_42320 [Streptomyces scabiei]|uniref:hypothetical protein n=1 Tax=Streptomyces scabiei TaxID=1930 RepID=UPI000765BCC4|nr:MULTISPECIES: hypothetical protein [Streptomyces]MBP5915884.1 hypothetical protein [Streptomyces sp. LBUM 1486]MDX2629167.1 hypothetical protein [Streptomyces scabiei]MDX3168266.1 hypothetical protein [Streptomyces scabiei]MDX3207790.1 hypothetical protein [Streptomyces scabiei]